MAIANAAIERVENFIERPPWSRRWFSFALGALVALVDYLSGPYVIVPTYFVLPVMLLAWNWGVRYAILLGIILSLAHIAFLKSWGMPGTEGIGALNAVLRTSVLLIIATITARLGSQTRASRERVTMLEGILPICSYCKDIRDENGEWQQIEAYVSQHSEALFSHGICAKCAETQMAKFRSEKGRA